MTPYVERVAASDNLRCDAAAAAARGRATERRLAAARRRETQRDRNRRDSRSSKRRIGRFTNDMEMARVTGLEPATSGVTGRRSNQLSYTRAFGVAGN